MKNFLLAGILLLPFVCAQAATWKCVDVTGHEYNSSQSVPVDKCTLNNADNGGASAPSKGAAGNKKIKPRSGGVFIGMSAEEVRTVGWGRPNSVNRTTTAYGVREQWVYGGKNYLYFEDGFLKTIQN